MHDVLRQRLMRQIESLPDEQVYQVLDFIEFLESKYAERHLQAEVTGLQRFAETLEDKMRRKAMNPATLREAFQLISAADRVLSSVSTAGRQIITELGTLGELESGTGGEGGRPAAEPRSQRGTASSDRDRDGPDERRADRSGTSGRGGAPGGDGAP